MGPPAELGEAIEALIAFLDEERIRGSQRRN